MYVHNKISHQHLPIAENSLKCIWVYHSGKLSEDMEEEELWSSWNSSFSSFQSSTTSSVETREDDEPSRADEETQSPQKSITAVRSKTDHQYVRNAVSSALQRARQRHVENQETRASAKHRKHRQSLVQSSISRFLSQCHCLDNDSSSLPPNNVSSHIPKRKRFPIMMISEKDDDEDHDGSARIVYSSWWNLS